MRDRKARILSETVLGTVLASLLVPGAVGAGQYTVRPGDTLFLIAQRYGTTVDTLRRTNGIWSDDLYPGQALNVPGSTAGGSTSRTSGSGGYTVQPGDTLFLIAQRYGTTVDALRQANGIWSDTLYPGQTLAIPSGSGSASRSSGGQTVEPGAGGDNAVWGSKYVITRRSYDLLARLVSAEAQGEPYAGQVAVAATVLRRMTDPRFPSTIEDIIYQVWDRYYYQYSPVQNGTIDYPAVPSAYRAVEDALNGADPSYGANGFYNPAGTENSWVTQQPVTTVIGNHVFFKS